MTDSLLALNAGSSSMKFALHDAGEVDRCTLSGAVERIGSGAARIAWRSAGGGKSNASAVEAPDHSGALTAVLKLLEHTGDTVLAVGHRMVHGGPDHAQPALLDTATLAGLTALIPLAPLHQPHSLSGVRAAQAAFPGAVQVGCFDTAFHATKPWINATYGLDTEWFQRGVRRYGFHGLSYRSVLRSLSQTDPALASGPLVIAHLGNGASVCAIRDRQSVATTMGFSALDGLVMGTRCGSIDPGVLLYFMRERGMDAAAIETELYHRSGMLGLSGVSSDMRDIEADGGPRATAALDYYVARAAEEIARMLVAAGGAGALIFCGGVGENAAGLRSRILDRLAPVWPEAHARARVVATREEHEIATQTASLL